MEGLDHFKSTSREPLLGDCLVDRYKAIRRRSLKLCEVLSTEDMVIQPAPEVSPPKWHLAHTTWFFEEMILTLFLKGFKKFNPDYKLLFNSYYKSMGEHWRQSERGSLSRPFVSEILDYRKYIDEKMIFFLEGVDESQRDLFHLIEAGIQHEQQHQELLLMDIKYIFATNPLSAQYSMKPLNIFSAESKLPWVDFREGIYEIGYNGVGFFFDNEGPRHKAYLYPFAISPSYTTNREYLEFVQSGAYECSEFWLSLGWDWIQQKKINAPLYWKEKKGKWWEYTMHGLCPLHEEAPVCHLSYFEADAFARWKGARLPSEQESEVFLDGQRPIDLESEEVLFHPYRASSSQGQLWWWTKSQYSPYPRYNSFEGNLSEYNGKFMCNQFVLKGGCFATPKGHHRNSYRNFYLPEQRWMFSGLRLARDI